MTRESLFHSYEKSAHSYWKLKSMKRQWDEFQSKKKAQGEILERAEICESAEISERAEI